MVVSGHVSTLLVWAWTPEPQNRNTLEWSYTLEIINISTEIL